MTVQNPSIFLQAGSHPAEDVRRMFHANAGGAPTGAKGIFETGDLLVSEKSGTPDMSVDVAEGACMIAGDEATYQGSYFAENRGVENLAISAADATNPRKDLVVAQVEDSDYSGATDAWKLAVVTGTPAASPAEPAVPSNAIVLAMVDVAALASSIVDANITDRRVVTQEGRMPNGIIPTTSAARPSSPYAGMMIYETDTLRTRQWDGTQWLELQGPTYDWTPTITSGLTIGNGTITGHYSLQGWQLTWYLLITLGSTSVMGTNPKIEVPTGMTLDNNSGALDSLGMALASDNNAGPLYYSGITLLGDSGDNTISTRVVFNTATISATTPFTWAASDRLWLAGTSIMDDVNAPTS
jgi:hypothetical protein